jgi:butyrate kinase
MRIYKTVEAEVEIDLAEFDTEELEEELASRAGHHNSSFTENLHKIADAINLNQIDSANRMFEEMLYQYTGRIICTRS